MSLDWEQHMWVPSTQARAPWVWLLLPIPTARVRDNPEHRTGDAFLSALLCTVKSFFFPSIDFSRWKSLSSPWAHAPGALNSKQTPTFGSLAVVLFRWQKAGSEYCRGAGELVRGSPTTSFCAGKQVG